MNSEDEEELCEYERKRLQNIKRNQEFLRSLGNLTVVQLVLVRLAGMCE